MQCCPSTPATATHLVLPGCRHPVPRVGAVLQTRLLPCLALGDQQRGGSGGGGTLLVALLAPARDGGPLADLRLCFI